MLAETKAPIGGKEVSLGAYQARLASRCQLNGRDILIESHSILDCLEEDF